jgi:teichuronic acid biosynthesis glycosyltransferase TuaC
MRVLAITPIFPNRLEPNFGPFNRQQFGAMVRAGGVELKVLCSVPWLPGAGWIGKPKRAAEMASLGKSDVFDGIETRYLRRLYVPKVGVPVGVPLYLASLAPHQDLVRWADVILGSWAYPDASAAVLGALAANKPVAVKVHGSDMNVLAKMRVVRAVLSQVLPRADALLTVSRPMGESLAELGVDRSKIHLLPNGIDRALFGKHTRAEARKILGLDPQTPLILYVGRIEPQKGCAELLESFTEVHRARPDVTLAVVGDGVWRARADAARASYGGRLLILGGKPLSEIATWMAACDLFTLPSHAEGTPNVLLEALASGRPAVATRVGGIPDVLADPRSGILVEPKSGPALAAGLLDGLERTWDAAVLRSLGPISWDESGAQLKRILERLVHARRQGGRGSAKTREHPNVA